MKDISTILKKGNLTAKERALIFISTQIEEDKIGKKVLDAKLIEAIKDEQAFKNDKYINTYNNYVKAWTRIAFVNINIEFVFMQASQILETLKTVAFIISKTSLLSAKLKDVLNKIQESDENIKKVADVYFETGLAYAETLNPFSVVKQGSNAEKTIVDLEKDLKTMVSSSTNNFLMLYSVLLAQQKILKMLSKELGMNVSYKTDSRIKALEETASNYNNFIELGLVDFNTDKASVEEIIKVKDKIFSDRKLIYLDLEAVSYHEETFVQCISIFEEFLGEKFWES